MIEISLQVKGADATQYAALVGKIVDGLEYPETPQFKVKGVGGKPADRTALIGVVPASE